MQELIDQVRAFFREKELPYEWYVTREGKVEVDVPDGDWKHDHIYLDWVMDGNGYEKVGERQYGEPTGGDWYSSVHVFKVPVATGHVPGDAPGGDRGDRAVEATSTTR